LGDGAQEAAPRHLEGIDLGTNGERHAQSLHDLRDTPDSIDLMEDQLGLGRPNQVQAPRPT
jgi:hypothetical protein